MRTLLAVLSIAAGVFAIGAVFGMVDQLLSGMDRAHQAVADLSTAPESAAAPGSSGEPILEIAGPREESLVDLAIRLVVRRGGPVRIEGVSDPADPDRDVFEKGGPLPGPHATLAGPTFEEWLDPTS